MSYDPRFTRRENIALDIFVTVFMVSIVLIVVAVTMASQAQREIDSMRAASGVSDALSSALSGAKTEGV